MTCRPFVVDASSIIQIKHQVPANQQWDILKRLELLVEAASLVFPREVAREVKAIAHPDAPGVWVHGVEGKCQHRMDPSDASVRRVLAQSPQLVDPDKELVGDPYVVALALELSAEGHGPTVISDDVNDRPGRTSLRTAAISMGLPHGRLSDLLTDPSFLATEITPGHATT